MYRMVLLCYDGTLEGRRLLQQGADVAAAMNAGAYLLAVRRDVLSAAAPEGVTPELVTAESNAAQELLDGGVQWLREQGLATEGALLYGDPLTHIPQTAARIGADLIVVGYRYRKRFARWWSESEEAMLLDRVNCSVLVAVAPRSS